MVKNAKIYRLYTALRSGLFWSARLKDNFLVNVSLRRRSLRGGFRFTVADSEPAEFTFGGDMDGEKLSFSLALQNKPLLKAEYMGADVSCRPGKLTAELKNDGGGMEATSLFSLQEFQAEIDGGTLNPAPPAQPQIQSSLLADETHMDQSAPLSQPTANHDLKAEPPS